MPAVKIYAASAGTGKTFTLVREYLKILFRKAEANNYYAYQQVMAITFTIKATEELKSRIIAFLRNVALGIENDDDYMEEAIASTLQPDTNLPQHARKILQFILRDYSNFNIQTIDSLFQDMIRSFARELDLNLNYEIELDPTKGKEYAVKELIAKVGKDKRVTKWLEQYAISRIDNDKGWSFRDQLESFSQELFREDIDLASLAAHGEQMTAVRKQVNHQVKNLISELSEVAQTIWDKMETASLPMDAYLSQWTTHLGHIIDQYAKGPKDFGHSDTFFKMLNEEKDLVKAANAKKYQAEYEQLKHSIGDDIRRLRDLFEREVPVVIAAKEALNSIYALGVLHLLHQFLNQYKEKRNVMYLSDGLQFISKFITTAEIPFLFEKIGHQIRYLFIDEFQDTSRQQWNNLLPLLRNILSTTEREMAILLVGDAKQSIYRWRGGDSDIITTQAEADLKTFEVETEGMPTNYRSGEHIVTFNNRFFDGCVQISDRLGNEQVQQETQAVYAHMNQTCKDSMKDIGHVTIDLVEKPDSDEEDDWKSLAMDQMLEYIEAARKKGYRPGDMAILIRNKKDGYRISRFLQDNNYDVVSNGSLLLDADDEVRLLMAALYYVGQPSERLLYTNLIWQLKKQRVPEEHMAADLLSDNFEARNLLTTWLPELANRLNALQEASSYEAFLQIADMLNLSITANSYLTSLQQLLYDFYRKESPQLADFLEFWDEEKEHRAIQSTADPDKIRMLTIHNSKGLEFPIVLMPICEWPFEFSMFKDLKWLSDERIAEGIQLPYRMVSSMNNSIFSHIYEDERNQRWIDSLNLLYVAFTRAIYGLHVIGLQYSPPKTSKDWLLPKTPSQLFYEIWHQWNMDGTHYEAGSLPIDKPDDKPATEIASLQTDATSNVPYSLKNQFESEETRIGDLVHQAFYYPDVDGKQALQKARFDLNARPEEKEQALKHMETTLRNPAYTDLTDRAIRSWSEQELIYRGEIIRPDKILELEDAVYVIDYKTGNEAYDHVKQITRYSAAVAELFPQKETRACIVYTDTGVVEEVSLT